MQKLRLLIIDGTKAVTEVEVDREDFKKLKINPEKVVTHKSKRQVLLKVSEYLDTFSK